MRQWHFPDAGTIQPQREQLQNALTGLTAIHKVVPGHVQGMAELLIGIFLDAENKRGIYEADHVGCGSGNAGR